MDTRLLPFSAPSGFLAVTPRVVLDPQKFPSSSVQDDVILKQLVLLVMTILLYVRAAAGMMEKAALR